MSRLYQINVSGSQSRTLLNKNMGVLQFHNSPMDPPHSPDTSTGCTRNIKIIKIEFSLGWVEKFSQVCGNLVTEFV